jgi:hypothetical protein
MAGPGQGKLAQAEIGGRGRRGGVRGEEARETVIASKKHGRKHTINKK